MGGITLLWTWLLKYSAFLASGVLSVLVAWCVDRFVTRRARLIYYASHPQWVLIPAAPGQQPPPAPGPLIETFSLYLFNQGKAPAREVHLGHYFLPACSVYPDIPREILQTPGGGTAIRFPAIPPGVVITVSYLVFGNYAVENTFLMSGLKKGQLGKYLSYCSGLFRLGSSMCSAF